LREERKLQVSQNKALKKMLGHNELSTRFRMPHNEKFSRLYRSPSIVRVVRSLRWGRHVEERRQDMYTATWKPKKRMGG